MRRDRRAHLPGGWPVSAAKGRSAEVLAVEVDALHAWLCAVVAVMVADRQARGLPIPPGLVARGNRSDSPEPQMSSPRTSNRHLSLVVSR